MIDTHAHIYLEQFENDIDNVIERSQEAGIQRIYLPNIDHTSIDAMLSLEYKYPELCIPMMGLHPCSVNADFEKELYIVEDWLSERKFVAVGEIGTDLYWAKTYWDQQQEALNIQLDFAKQYQIPAIIHCRESIDETISLVENKKDYNLNGIFHCFTGNIDQANRIIELGFYLGIGGVATFKNGGLDEVLPDIPLEKIVLETDSPYLSPVPHRGKRNEPAYLELVAKRVAELHSVDADEVITKTTEVAQIIFQ